MREKPHQPDRLDRELLNHLQSDFPLGPRPFAVLGERVGLGEEEVCARIVALKEARIVRQISAIFDSRRLGYRSSLVAMKFPEERVDEAAQIINQHPGVSHNYRRNHAFNLWFTIAVPPRKSLVDEVNGLAVATAAEQTRLLPALKLYKIGLHLDMTGEQEVTEREGEGLPRRAVDIAELQADDPGFSEAQRQALRALQQDLPLVPRPFQALAEAFHTTEADLLKQAEAFLRDGQMRRFAAVLHHRTAGFEANGMGVWAVPDERCDEVGLKMASFAAVSHCYRRPTYPDWPYSLFTMIHGRHEAECHAVMEGIARETGIREYSVLFSTKEYKKVRVKYFMEDEG